MRRDKTRLPTDSGRVVNVAHDREPPLKTRPDE